MIHEKAPAWLAQLKIRYLTQTDLPDLEWDGQYTHFRRLYTEIYQSSLKGKAVLWVAELKDKGIIGQLFVQLTSSRPELADGNRRAYIYGFRVKTPFRSFGIGTRMLHAAETDLARRGFKWVTLNVGRDNPLAHHLYERQGYILVGEEPGIWSYQDDLGNRHEVHEPAYRMEKKLIK